MSETNSDNCDSNSNEDVSSKSLPSTSDNFESPKNISSASNTKKIKIKKFDEKKEMNPELEMLEALNQQRQNVVFLVSRYKGAG